MSFRRFEIARNRRVILASLASAASLLFSASAQAQTGFALDRFEPSERGSEWFALDSLDLRGKLRPAVGVVGDWGYKPLVIYDSKGDEKTAVVRHQLFFHVGAALNVADRLRFAVNVPLQAFKDGDNGTVNGVQLKAPSGQPVGDVRLGADVRLFGKYRGPLQLAAGLNAYLPTGSKEAYAGDGKVRLTPHVLAAGEFGVFVYSAKLGFQWRSPNDPTGGKSTGSEMLFGAAAGARAADGKLVVGPEIYGSTVVSESGSAFSKRATPFEVIIGAHYLMAKDWRIGAGVGPGLTRGYGSPQLRVVASIEWFPAVEEPPPPPPPDRDGDGIYDYQDACPDQPGPKSEDPKKNGCPPPPDRDKDGILDSADACPDQPGVPTEDPKTNGCPPPPPDRDKDGIPDAEDACPDQPGVPSQDPKLHGCPPADPDRDKDGIVNEQDACPDEAGKADPDPKKNGCPSGAVVGTQIVVLDPVQFKTDSDVILPASDEVLMKVLATINKLPPTNRYRVEGHTDNKGNKAHNKDLSLRRAKSVISWMKKHDADPKRFDAAGFGPDRPIDSNDTDEGRQRNRRVEFHIASGTNEVTSESPAQKPAPQTAPKAQPKPHKGATPVKPEPKPKPPTKPAPKPKH
jgi:OmpA-OmpF porin, OOP family